MILAHLRGLLEPGYPNGIRSVLRERLILEALSTELAGRFTETRLMLDGMLTSPVLSQCTNSAQILSDLNGDLKCLTGYRELDPRANKVPVMSDQTQALKELYELLMEAGALDDDPNG